MRPDTSANLTARTATRTPPITTPARLAGAGAAVCALALLACVRGEWAAAVRVLLIDGAVTLAWLAGATGLGLTLLRASRVRFESALLQITIAASLGLGAESLVVLGLGLAGALNRIVGIAILCAGLALLFWMIPPLVGRRRGAEGVNGWSWLWLLAMPALGIALAGAPLPPGLLWGVEEPNGYDVVEYHLQVPREWYESGQIAPLRHNVFSHFPLGVEMHYLLAMHLRGGPWAGMYAAQLMHVTFVALSVLAVYGLLREWGARHAVVGAIVVATTPWMILLAPIGYNEGGLLLYGTLAVGLMALPPRSALPLRLAALAGAMAGFACGAKLTAGPMILLAVPVARVVSALLPLPPREGRGEGAFDHERRSMPQPASRQPSPGERGGKARAVIAAAAFVAVGVAAFSPWLIRNIVWTGNPVFPEEAQLFGRGHFTPEQVQRWQRAHARRDDQRSVTARFAAFAEQILLDWRFGYVLLPLAVVAAALEWRRGATWLVLLLTLLLLTSFWLVFTHLQGRFFVLAIPLAGLLTGQVRSPRAAAVFAAVTVLAGLVGMTRTYSKLRMNPEIFQATGLDRLTLLTPLADVTLRDDDRLILLGDARGFLYDVPMRRMQYRTVFDVPAGTDEKHWMRGFDVVPGKTIVLVDPSELARFTRTYRNLPPVPHALRDADRVIIERR